MTRRFIIGCLAVVIHIFFNSSTATVDISSEHYKLAVGQGECSTTISTLSVSDINTKYKVAVTADIGSSSLRADPKYVSGYNYDNFVPILERKYVTADVGDEDLFVSTEEPPQKRLPRAEFDRDRSPSLRGSQLEPSDKKVPTTSLTGESTFEGSFDFLINQLQNIDLWIVFLSHPDKDHINWLSAVFGKLAATTKLILVAGGEWFNTFSTEDIREVLGLVYAPDKQQRIFSFFPNEDGKLSRAEMAEWLKTNGSNIRKKDPSTFCPRKELNGKRLDQFHGTLTELFDVYQDKNPWSFIGLSSDESLTGALISLVFNKIYIWSLDYPIGNTNAQSIVWSHEVDDIGWTFVYTGDAENSTFEKILFSLKSSEKEGDQPTDVVRKRHKTGTTAVSNLIMMQGMHHGSMENVSSIAMELFCPNAIAFSAGNGASFAHPSIKAIQKYATVLSPQYTSNFWNSYSLENPYSFAAFSQRGEGEQGKALSIKIQEPKALFLCTNAYGTIKITSSAISIPFNTAQPGYYRYSLLHAYEQIKSHIFDFKTITVDGLIKKYDKKDEEYWQEPFWEQLKGKVLTQSEKDSSLYEDKHDAPFKLQMFTKIRDRQEYCFFYVLRKLSAEDNVILPVDTGIVPAEED